MSTFDEQITQALDLCLSGLRSHLESNFKAYTEALVRASAEERARAVAHAAEAAAMEVKHQMQGDLVQMRAAAQRQAEELRKNAATQIAELRSGAQQQLDGVRRSAEEQIEDIRRNTKAEVDEAMRAAEAQISEARRALDVELERLKAAAEADAEEIVISQLTEAQEQTERRLKAAVEQTRTEAQQAEVSSASRLVDAVRRLDEAGSLGEVLDTLVQCAGREVERAGILVTKGQALKGWKMNGFDLDPAAVRALEIDAAAVTDCARDWLPEFARGAGARHAVALPITVGGQVVAVLYADAPQKEGAAEASRWASVLEVLTRHASRSLEALTVQKTSGLARTAASAGHRT